MPEGTDVEKVVSIYFDYFNNHKNEFGYFTVLEKSEKGDAPLRKDGNGLLIVSQNWFAGPSVFKSIFQFKSKDIILMEIYHPKSFEISKQQRNLNVFFLELIRGYVYSMKSSLEQEMKKLILNNSVHQKTIENEFKKITDLDLLQKTIEHMNDMLSQHWRFALDPKIPETLMHYFR